jgi:hypothetical protein
MARIFCNLLLVFVMNTHFAWISETSQKMGTDVSRELHMEVMLLQGVTEITFWAR